MSLLSALNKRAGYVQVGKPEPLPEGETISGGEESYQMMNKPGTLWLDDVVGKTADPFVKQDSMKSFVPTQDNPYCSKCGKPLKYAFVWIGRPSTPRHAAVDWCVCVHKG